VPVEPARFMTADEAVALVERGDTVAVSGVLFNLVPEVLCDALERRFLATGEPSGLTEVHLNVHGFGRGTGLDHFAHPGMTRCMIGSSFPAGPWAAESPLTDLLLHDGLQAFAMPAGGITAMFRASAAGEPFAITRAGIGTFLDPRHGGGAITPSARSSSGSICEVVELDGEEWLRYPALGLDVSFVAGSRADRAGNVTFEDEPLHQAAVAQAMATKANGGTVIAQVREVVADGELDPRLVKLPSLWTDVIVVTDQEPFAYGVHNGQLGFSGNQRAGERAPETPPFSADSIVGERAIREVARGDVVNFGAGTPVRELPYALWARGDAENVHVSIDHGSLGGTNLGGLLAATHWNLSALIDSTQVYEYYAGTGIDIAFLGAAEVDGAGNVGVAISATAVPGIGGFADIVEAARTIVICTTLRRGGLAISVESGQLVVISEGTTPKFVERVEHVCLSADRVRAQGKRVLYVTERAVFTLGTHGLELIELAPGVSLEALRDAMRCDFSRAPTVMPMPISSPSVGSDKRAV
jgi:propionate CoA-transferase